jgi:hypothetical protein
MTTAAGWFHRNSGCSWRYTPPAGPAISIPLSRGGVRDDEEEVAVRPEIQSTVDEIQQVIGLLRRHL